MEAYKIFVLHHSCFFSKLLTMLIKFFTVFFALALLNLLIFSSSCSDLSYRESIQKIQRFEIERSNYRGIFNPYLINPRLHEAIAHSIGHIADTIHLDILHRLIRSEENSARKAAIFALGQINYEKSRRLLHELLDNQEYEKFAGDIINALRVNGNAESLPILIKFCERSADSLKAGALITITVIANRTSNSQRMSTSVLPYLHSDSEQIRNAAAYYFSRNVSLYSIRELVTASFPNNHTGNKYRYKALSQVAEKYKKLPIESTLLDTLRRDLESQLAEKDVPWYTKLYQLSLMSIYDDSLAMKKVATFLTDSIPHLRVKAIEVLGQWRTIPVRGILLGYYPTASWIEKGCIIKSLAVIDGNLAYRLIQQNLDRGTMRFKELLLESLSIINSSSAIGLLRQFLHVPNNRLNLFAFQRLADIRKIRSQDALLMLDSGDPALMTVASEWYYRHPDIISMQKIEESYNRLEEPDDIEALIALMRVASLKKQPENIPFFMNSLKKTRSHILFKQISQNLEKLGAAVADSLIPHLSLFVPPNVESLKENINVILTTSKGEIILDLWPHVAPLTVANFVYLAENGFYNGLTFHRVVSDFVIQGGDPRGDGWGGPEYYIPCEYNNKPYVRGSIGIATAGKDTGGSQFFICHTEQPHLNGRYTNFGMVINGINVVDRIQIDDKIIKVVIKKEV